MKGHTITKDMVKSFWEENTCGTQIADNAQTPDEYYKTIERFRYNKEPYIHHFAQFPKWKGKKILEIGVGAGTDFIQFVRAGAHATGVDLTQTGVDLAKKRLEHEHLQARVERADAEALPFPDNSFDFIYSWGVIHHTPDTQKTVDEIHRTLKHDGEISIMIYYKYSWVTFSYLILKGILRGQIFKKSLTQIISENSEWNNESNPLTKVYSKREARKMFRKFKNLHLTVLPTKSYGSGLKSKLFDFLNRLLPRFGWYLVIQGKKT